MADSKVQTKLDNMKGWWNPRPLSARSKFHLIGGDSRALCGGWLYMAGVLETGKDEHEDNCSMCVKKLKALKALIEKKGKS